MRLRVRLLLTWAAVAGAAVPLYALDSRVTELRAASAIVRAIVQLGDLFSDKYRKLVNEGGTLYVKIEAELWEDRAAWDRLVAPASVAVFRFRRATTTRAVTLYDEGGAESAFSDFPRQVSLAIDVAPTNRIEEARRYYVHAESAVGTVEQTEIDEFGDAVFGREAESSGLAALGKYVFRKAFEISEFFQSTTSETTSQKWTGKQIRGS